jgi:nucleotide-binding universal stress UspA family protein
MKNQTLLYLMTEQTADAEIRQVASHATGRNARLVCLLMSRMPTQPMNAYGAFPYGGFEVSDQWVEELGQTRERLKGRMDELERLLQAEGVPGDVQLVLSGQADVRAEIARRALVCDLAIAASDLRAAENGLFNDAAYAVLFESPIPLLLNAVPLHQPKRIFAAWDTQLPAARAIHAALPMMVEAEEVILATFDPVAVELEDGEDPGADLAGWLSHHGCKVTLNQYSSGGDWIGTAILRRAAEVGADLVVMGAFGKSRLRERVFGGTTRTMIDQAETPVFLAH